MNSQVNLATDTQEVELQPEDNHQLANLCGLHNDNLQLIEERLGLSLNNLGHKFFITGNAASSQLGAKLITQLYELAAEEPLTPEKIHLYLQEAQLKQLAKDEPSYAKVLVSTPKVKVKPKGANQAGYVQAIRTNDVNFGLGPAGTGKTYLAVACAVEALMKEEVKRLLLVRPAVEAGEKLGFLPGDLAQKIDPYLRPLYDALYEMLGFERVNKLIEKSIIEVAPLAFMRGRTLNNAFVILDESQNTTREQMKMFLTRLGFGSTAVITGDLTQIDLPRGMPSGLAHAKEVLANIPGISQTHFANQDVVRHPLVKRIVAAYEQAEAAAAKESNKPKPHE